MLSRRAMTPIGLMRLKRLRFILLFAFLLPAFLFAQIVENKSSQNVGIISPDKTIIMSVSISNGKFQYAVTFNQIPVIETSRLGITVNGALLGVNSSIGTISRYKFNVKYPFRGVHSTAVNNFNGARINISSPQSPFILEARVFNNGVAFRYIVPNTGNTLIEKDTTSFVLPAGTTVWSQSNVKYYEGKYGRKMIEDFKQDDLIGPPLTALLPNNLAYLAITEGGLTDFAGMSLRADGNRGFTANLAGDTHKSGEIETPWRIIEIGKDLNTLVNCDIISNVSPAYDTKLFPKGYETEWIRPGRSVWSWLAETRSITLDNMKRFSDYASQLGFEYNLVDEGWSNWKDSVNGRDQWDMIKELVDYSAKKGVKIWVWKAYPDRKGIPGIKDQLKRKEFFKKCKDLGIAGLKVDFFDSESQEIIDFYQAALRDAAEYHLMLDFHGSNKPTGETRTWPNEMSREGIKGLESRSPWAPTNVILPFTRYLAGHADYTPVNFDGRLGEVSWSHHVATMVIFTSPFLCLGVDPRSLINNPAKNMIQSIPSTWDETIVLPQSRIGELALYARRKGTTWFIAALNGIHEPKTIELDLDFLKNGSFYFNMLKDDETKQANVIIENKILSAQTSLKIHLNPEGGFVARILRVK